MDTLRSVLTGVQTLVTFESSTVTHTTFFEDGANALVAGFWRLSEVTFSFPGSAFM